MPGEGILPVHDFLRALPPDITIGLEAPCPDIEWNARATDLLAAVRRVESEAWEVQRIVGRDKDDSPRLAG